MHHQHRPPENPWPAPYDVMLQWHAATQTRLLLRTGPDGPPSLRVRRRGQDDGFVSVESIGWIGIAVAVVAAVGLIVKTKLVDMAASLPDTLGW